MRETRTIWALVVGDVTRRAKKRVPGAGRRDQVEDVPHRRGADRLVADGEPDASSARHRRECEAHTSAPQSKERLAERGRSRGAALVENAVGVRGERAGWIVARTPGHGSRAAPGRRRSAKVPRDDGSAALQIRRARFELSAWRAGETDATRGAELRRGRDLVVADRARGAARGGRRAGGSDASSRGGTAGWRGR